MGMLNTFLWSTDDFISRNLCLFNSVNEQPRPRRYAAQLAFMKMKDKNNQSRGQRKFLFSILIDKWQSQIDIGFFHINNSSCL